MTSTRRWKLFSCAALLAIAGCGPGGGAQPATGDGAAASADCQAGPRDPAERGPYAIGFTYRVMQDPSRTDDVGGVRGIPVHLWYPVDPRDVDTASPEAVYPLDPVYAPGKAATSSEVEAYGIDRAYQDPLPSRRRPFPLVLLSPGWSQDASFYAFTAGRLASHGFVVAGLTHPGDGDFVTGSGVPGAKVMFDRPRDLSFVLTQLLSWSSSRRGRWHRLVDPQAVAAMGHSIGGYGALVLASGDDDTCEAINELFGEDYSGPWCAGSAPDPRVKAVIRLDSSEWALSWQELARIQVPTITLNEDTDAFAAWCPGDNARAHAAISSRVNLRVDVMRSNHQSFSRLCDWLRLYMAKGIFGQAVVDDWSSWACPQPPLLDPHLANLLVTQTVVAFLKTHLLGEAGYAQYLSPRWIWDHQPELGLFRTEEGGESHYGYDSILTCLPRAFLETEPGFDFYWYMPEPRGWP